MINELSIANFKAHKFLKIDLSNLNILTGINSTGKSSVIQALLLLRQSYLRNNSLLRGLLLNGDLIEVGVGKDAFHEAGSGDLTIQFKYDEKSYKWDFQRSLESNFLKLQYAYYQENLEQISLFNRNFQYISAEHISPKEVHQRDTLQVEIDRQISEKKGRGEFAVHFLYRYGSDKIISPIFSHPEAKSDSVLHQVDAWLSEISPQIRAVIHENYDENTFRLRFQYESQYGYTGEYKPQNVGFGISYALPFVVALLTATKDSILIFENPEAHLHPVGQSKLAELISLVAQAGVQIFVETHSDHIVNGVLVSIKSYKDKNIGISKDHTKIFYFNTDYQNKCSNITDITFSEDGVIDSPPTGFFDQIEKDLGKLMGI